MKNKNLKRVILVFLLLIIYLFFFKRKDMDIYPLKQFVDNCIPCQEEINKPISDRNICPYLPVPPDDVIKILRRRIIDDEFKKIIILAYLKLYKSQMYLYHQGFDVRESPFFIKRFYKSGAFASALCEVIEDNFIKKKLGSEFISGDKVCRIAENNKLYSEDKEIRLVLDSIQKIIDYNATY